MIAGAKTDGRALAAAEARYMQKEGGGV